MWMPDHVYFTMTLYRMARYKARSRLGARARVRAEVGTRVKVKVQAEMGGKVKVKMRTRVGAKARSTRVKAKARTVEAGEARARAAVIRILWAVRDKMVRVTVTT